MGPFPANSKHGIDAPEDTQLEARKLQLLSTVSIFRDLSEKDIGANGQHPHVVGR